MHCYIFLRQTLKTWKTSAQKSLFKQKPMWLTEEEIRVKTDADVNIYYLDFVTGKHPIPPAFIDRHNEHNPYPEISKEEEKVEPWKVYLRECDTLDTFMCSSFYYLRFCDPHNTNQIISDQAINYMPIDLYVGGKEHSVGHLIYARFIYKFLRDYGYIKHDFPEPFKKLVHQGMIHGADGRKMSKRWWNIIDPLDVIKEYNADTMRTYLAFMGPVELQKNRNPDSVAGVHRFLKRFEKLAEKVIGDSRDVGLPRPTTKDLTSLIHQTIKGFSEDMDNLKFNTAISKLMIACNSITESGSIDRELLSQLVLLLAPFCARAVSDHVD
jgi:leucyl-tRNA synthetase